jgi:hypothetical protein
MPDMATGKWSRTSSSHEDRHDKDHNVFTMSGSKDGKDFKVMEIDYTRVSSRAAQETGRGAVTRKLMRS